MTKVEVSCSYCEAKVWKLSKYINAAKKCGKSEFFCNNKCACAFRNHQVIMKCKGCDKEVSRTPSVIARSKTGNVYCSTSCSNKVNNRLFKSGENHPLWISGKSMYRSRVNIDECKCGCKLAFILLVHHKDGNRDNNDPSNLEVVCPTCHALRHVKEVDGRFVVDSKFITTDAIKQKLSLMSGCSAVW